MMWSYAHHLFVDFARHYQRHTDFDIIARDLLSTHTHTHTGLGGVPGGGMPVGLGDAVAERGGGAPAAGRRRAGEEKGKTGAASQANFGRGGETGRRHERCGRKEGEGNNNMFVDATLLRDAQLP